MTTENDDEGSREQWSRWEGAESQVSSHAGAALCSAALCACVQFKQSAECGLFEGHVVSGFIGHAACAPPKKSFPDQLKNILFSFSFKITSMLKKWRAVAITGGQILHAVRTANLKK